MKKTHSIVLFNQRQVRRFYDEKREIWNFSIIDIIEILTDSTVPKRYWSDLKGKLKNEGSEVYERIVRLKMIAPDGKQRETDCFSTEDVLRVVQSIPSPKAEPFKIWLAKVGYQRLQETVNPEIAVDRARSHWKHAGRSEKWIEQRMRSQETRNKLTDYWKESGVREGVEYAALTDIIHHEWSGLTTQLHKRIKGLKGQNLRDNMTEAELIFTALAELSTTHIAKSDNAKGFDPNSQSARKGGRIAGNARMALEAQTGKKVVSAENFLPPKKGSKKLK